MGLTPTAMAARLCCSLDEVRDYECGARRIGATTLMRLAHICAVDLGYFFAEVPSSPAIRREADQASSSS